MGRGAGSIGLGKGHQTMECVLSDHQSIGVREARCMCVCTSVGEKESFPARNVCVPE